MNCKEKVCLYKFKQLALTKLILMLRNLSEDDFFISNNLII